MTLLEALKKEYVGDRVREEDFLYLFLDGELTHPSDDYTEDGSVGVFRFLDDVLPPHMLYEMSVEYYLNRSGHKEISPVYEKAMYVFDVDKTKQFDPSFKLSFIIQAKFEEKWTEMTKYLLENQTTTESYEETETRTGNRNNSTNYGAIVTNSDTEARDYSDATSNTYDSKNTRNYNAQDSIDNSDTTTFNTTVEDDGNQNSKIVTDTENGIAGFNSKSYVDADSTKQTVIGNKNDNTTHNSSVKTGTETVSREGLDQHFIDDELAHTGTDTMSVSGTSSNTMSGTRKKTGTDTNTGDYEETVTRKGRDIPAQDLFIKNMDIRDKYNFFNIVFADIDTILTCPMYK